MAWNFFTSSGVNKRDVYYDPSPVGIVTPYGGSTAPSGWLLCQGQEVAIATYGDLYGAIGQTYGSTTNGSGSSGSTHFRLPDLRGRVPIGTGAGKDNQTGVGSISGDAGLNRPLGGWGGSESVTIQANQCGSPTHTHTITYAGHSHTATLDSHTHTVDNYDSAASYDSYDVANYSSGTPFTSTVFANVTTSYSSTGANVDNATAGISSTSTDGSKAATSSHNNEQPYIVLNFIIKT